MRLPSFAAGFLRKCRRLYFTLRYRRIWTKLALLLLLCVNIPVVALCFLLMHNSRKAVTAAVLAEHAEIVTRIAHEISDHVGTPRVILQSLASQMAVSRPDPWQQETMLVSQVISYPFFLRIASLAADGSVIANSDMTRNAVGRDEDAARGLERVLGGGEYASGIRDISMHSPYIMLMVPLIEQGRVAGALAGEVNLRHLWRILDGIALGKTGNVLVVSADGTLIAARDKKKVLAGADFARHGDARQALTGLSGAMVLVSDGRKWVSSFAPVPGLGWGVLLRQELAEALSCSDAIRRQSLLLLLFVEFFVVAISVMLARSLANPLRQMVGRLKEVAEGNLEGKIRQRRYDEIGVLFKTFNAMLVKLKKIKEMERFSIIGEASACIAHEFKNSIIALKSFVQLFPDKHDDKEFVEMFASLVPAELRRWERMLKDLSDFSSVDTMVKQPVSLGGVIGEVLSMFSADCRHKGINFSFTQLAEQPVQADRERMKQVLMNAILNSIQAMPQGGEIEITEEIVRKEQSYYGQYLSIAIRDTGRGIPPGVLDTIFEPFHSKKSGSLGLGLAICRRIIANHGGIISIESRLKEGTIFTIRLPL